MAIKTTLKVLGAVVALAIASQVSAADPEGNRYGRTAYYKSEISASEAYLIMEPKGGLKRVPENERPYLIDVRTLREYASGHPEKAHNIPYPSITGFSPEKTQNPLDFYWMVHDLVGGRMDAPIMLLCRTGSRSVNAGNILANPESNSATAGKNLEKFTNVRNIWEGFLGMNKYAMLSNGEIVTSPTTIKLDLNNNNAIDVDTADVYAETTDKNPDKDGWRNFAGLPWTTDIDDSLAYQQDPSLYDALNLTPVP